MLTSVGGSMATTGFVIWRNEKTDKTSVLHLTAVFTFNRRMVDRSLH